MMRQFQYQAAADLLYAEFEKNTNRTELSRIANLIRPCGMIPEAIDALHRMDSSIEEYKADPPADEPISASALAPQTSKRADLGESWNRHGLHAPVCNADFSDRAGKGGRA